MYKNILKNKKKVIVIGFVVIILLIVICSVCLLKDSEVKAPETNKIINNNFQKSTDTDFSKVDPNISEEVLNKLKEEYNSAQKKLKEDQFDYDANITKASILYRIKEYDKAVIIYKKLGELKPDDYTSFKSLGDVYYAQKKHKEAEQAYLVAIKNNPYNPSPYLQLAEVYKYYFTDDENKIKKFYEDGIAKLGVNRFSLIQSYADYLEHIGEDKNAIEQWKIVSEEFPDNQAIKDRIKKLENELK